MLKGAKRCRVQKATGVVVAAKGDVTARGVVAAWNGKVAEERVFSKAKSLQGGERYADRGQLFAMEELQGVR